MNSEEEAEDQEDDTMTDESNPSATKKARIATKATSIEDSKIETQVKKTTPIVRGSSRARKKVIAYVAGPASSKSTETNTNNNSFSSSSSSPLTITGSSSSTTRFMGCNYCEGVHKHRATCPTLSTNEESESESF